MDPVGTDCIAPQAAEDRAKKALSPPGSDQ
jgi:hypothetical protein